ncbi:MAG: hypothetical protein E4H25_00970, partial [Methanomassiliicoccus sp.]
MSEGLSTSESASENASPEPITPSKGKGGRKLWLMIVAIIVAILLLSTVAYVLLVNDDGGDDIEEPAEMELVVTVYPTTPVVVEAGSTVMLYVSSALRNVDTDETVSLDGNTSVDYTWKRDPITIGSFDLSGNRYCNLTVSDAGGTGTISCLVEVDELNATVSKVITINPPYLTSVSVVPVSKTLTVDASSIFTATAFDSVGDAMSDLDFSWEAEGMASGDYTLNATTGRSVTFTGLAEGVAWLNATTIDGTLSATGSSMITITSDIPERSVDYYWYDMFNVPFGEWYDKRSDEIPWDDSYPYVYDWVDESQDGNIWTYSNMRLDITGRNMTDVSMNENPLFVPNLGTTTGGNVVLDWYFTYGTDAELDLLSSSAHDNNDGWITIFEGVATLDMAAAMSVLGMPADQWSNFDTWWAENQSRISEEWGDYINSEANDRLDIYCMYEYMFQSFKDNITAERVGDTVVVNQLIVSWGFEALMSRWLHDAWMDDTEYWFEDFSMHAEIGPEMMDIDISTAIEYAIYAYETTDDGLPCWMWEGLLADYITAMGHPSLFEIYEAETYLCAAPGSPLYGQEMFYDYVPGALNLTEGETLRFTWPAGDQMFLKHVKPGEYELNDYAMTVDYMEPMGVDFPGQIDVDTTDRTIEFRGPIDMWTWSRDQDRSTWLETEWDRMLLLPYGMPTIEFRLTGPVELTSFDVSGYADPIVEGESSSFTVTALDQFDEPFPSFVGTITFSSSDPLAVLPDDFTFDIGDSGTYTFPAGEVIFNTPGEQELVVNYTDDMDISGLQFGITVTEAPYPYELRVENVTTPMMEGESSGFDVIVLDQYGALYPTYTGTIEFSSNDSAAVFSPTQYEFMLIDGGMKTFASDAVTFMTPGVHDLTAYDVDTPSISGSQLDIVVEEIPVPHFVLTGVVDPSYANESLSDLTVTVLDQWDNPYTTYVGIVTFTCTDPLSPSLTNYEFDILDAGEASFPTSVIFGTPGMQTLTATDTVDGTITGSVTVEVLAEAVATYLDVYGISNTVTQWINESVTVDVYDQYDRIFPGYDGTINFTANDTGVNFPENYTFEPATDLGSHTFEDLMNFTELGWYEVTATDTGDPSLTGYQTDIFVTDVGPYIAYFTVTGITSMWEGNVSDVLVTAFDQYDNVFNDYAGTIEFSTDAASGESLPTDYTFVPATDDGDHLFSNAVSFDDPGTFSVTVTDTVDTGATGTQSGIVIEDLLPSTLKIEGAPMEVDVGSSFTLTVSVYHQYDELDAEYTGTVEFESSDLDGSVELPSDYTFVIGDAGTRTFTNEFVLMTAGAQTIDATDTSDGSLTDSAPITVVIPRYRSMTYTMYDMFEEPWGEWWTNEDWGREVSYPDSYVITSDEGNNTLLYMPGYTVGTGSEKLYQGMIFAPYRWAMEGEYLPELTVTDPEFMPVRGPTTVTGTPSVSMDLYFQYLSYEWWDDYWIPTWGDSAGWEGDDLIESGNDGYYLGTNYSIVMNRPAAEVWLNMPQTSDPATWWATNGASYKSAWQVWIDDQGNNVFDIWCGFEWPYVDLATMMDMTVDGDGNVVLSIGHVSWGFEILMCRWLDDANICTHQPYWEDFHMQVEYGTDDSNMTSDAVCQYSMHAVKANGSVDAPAWVWEPIRIDYTTQPGHPSEYTPYVNLKYTSWNCGDALLGQEVKYDTTPGWLDLGEHDALIFQLPMGEKIGYQGKQTTNPYGDYEALIVDGDNQGFMDIREDGTLELGYFETNPSSPIDLMPMYDDDAKTLTISGPKDFDSVHRLDGSRYHGAPWIEFNVTASPPKALALVTPTEIVSGEQASATEMSSSAEVASLTVVAVA